MMDYVEVEVKTTNAKGETARVFGEYATDAETPHEAAREIIDAMVKRVGNDRMREIDPAI